MCSIALSQTMARLLVSLNLALILVLLASRFKDVSSQVAPVAGGGLATLDLVDQDQPPSCTINKTSLFFDPIVFAINGTTQNLTCDTRVTDDSLTSFGALLNINPFLFNCSYYYYARFPDTGQCLPAVALPGISCTTVSSTFSDINGNIGIIHRSILHINVTESLDRVTLICDRGERVFLEPYNHTTLLVPRVPQRQPDLLPTQLITGISVGSALLCLLLVQGIVILYSSPDF